jgi:hypothetical protein
MKKLPIGIQSFENLREENYLYVDKTKDIHRLISSGKVYFLSRPRRFGKSLLISTLDAIFKGKKSLFENLYIYDQWDWTQQHPVVRIDWSNIKHSLPEEMEKDMSAFLNEIATRHQITLSREYASSCFKELIEQLHYKTGSKVVVLVDEYDMPILDALSKPAEDINEIRNFLQSFYKVLKGADEHLRFVFLTGVSKFTKVSIFSGLNNLNDITIDPNYTTICGYTQPELESYFDENIEQLAQIEHLSREELLQKIKYWYNGYSWDGITSVYNPFSTLLFFNKNQFSDYWFASGTPTFLVNIIKERNDVKLLLEPTQIQSSGFDSFDYQTMDTQLLSFQTGYLTIKKAERDPFDDIINYTLSVPNEEVRRALAEHLFVSYAAYPMTNTGPMRSRMLHQLLTGDSQAFERSLQEMFARIPYQLHIPREAYYHSLFLLWLNLLGFDVQAEVSTDKGRIDAVWTWNERVVIAEIKYIEEGLTEPLLEEAFTQIIERRYFERYAGENRRIAFLAVAFAGKEIACRLKECE